MNARVGPVGLILLSAWTARAEPSTDGVYGRLDGDLDLGLSVGAEVAPSQVMGAGRATLHYFWMAGIYASYANALRAHADPARHLAVGVDLRPLFVPRWSKALEQGPAFFDLMLDSLALGVGAYWSEPRRARFGHQRGFEGSLGLGLPLLGRARGAWLQVLGILRSADPGLRPPQGSVQILFGWHELVATPLLDSWQH